MISKFDKKENYLKKDVSLKNNKEVKKIKMVSKNMKKYGKVAAVLDEKEYGELEGLLKECLPAHVPIDIGRKKGKIELWSLKPGIMRNALERARNLHKKYGTDAMSKIWEEPRIKVKEEKPKKIIKPVIVKKKIKKIKKKVVKKKPKKKPKKKKLVKKKPKKKKR